MDKDNKNRNPEIDDLPELDLDILDELLGDVISEETDLSVAQPQEAEVLSDEIPSMPQMEIPVTPQIEIPVMPQIETPEPVPVVEEPIEELVFVEEDKISLFDDDDDDDDLVLDLDAIASELPPEWDDEDEDLVFVDAVSVRDRRKITELKLADPVQQAPDIETKTHRRAHDVTEMKKERARSFTKRNIIAIGIAALVIIVIIGAIVVAGRKFKENHSDVPKTSGSEEAFLVDRQEDIEALMGGYFKAVADNDTYVLKETLNPVIDNQMEYFRIMNDYVDAYENVVCYAKDGMDEGDYMVAAYYEVKYAKVMETAPGMTFYYVSTDSDGELYINNLYSQHNLIYLEAEPNADVVAFMEAFKADPSMQSMMTQVQTSYEEKLAANDKLKELIEITIPEALADWSVTMQPYLDMQEEVPVVDSDTTTPDDTVPADPVLDGTAAETPADGLVYAADNVNIRQTPSTEAVKVASVYTGAELTRLAVTDNGWTKVKTGDITGYVKTEFLTDTKPAGGAVTGTYTANDTLNIRVDKSADAALVNVVTPGETVTILEGDSEGWTKVKYKDAVGYIRSDLLQ